MKKNNPIDEYIASKPEEVRGLLEQMRAAIRAVLPDAQEKISYGIPCYHMDSDLVYFAAFKHHIGFYPTSSGIAAFEKDLAPYKSSKGAVQFPFDKPLPLKLVARIAKFRLAEVKKKKKAATK